MKKVYDYITFDPELIKREEINLYIYHKCPICGRFMKNYNDTYKCVKWNYTPFYGIWEHD